MPCYDKKLEASRQDFYNESYSTRDVDCVITTGELDLMMREKGWNLSTPVEGENVTPPLADLPELVPHVGTSSGSYLHSLMHGAVATSPEPLDLVERQIRTVDYQEYTLLKKSTGEIVFKGAKCYGFRNLQNVVRKVGREAGVHVGKGAAGRMATPARTKLKRAIGDATNYRDTDKGYDYVEVMACPSGCVNGGGQLRPPPRSAIHQLDEDGEEGVGGSGSGMDVVRNARWGDKEWTKKVENAYWDSSPQLGPSVSPGLEEESMARITIADRLALRVLVELCQPKKAETPPGWLVGSMDEEAEVRRKLFFRTRYHAVSSEVEGLAVKW
jgi:hypothetical protein